MDLWGIKPWEHALLTVEQFYRMCDRADYRLEHQQQ